MHGTVLLDQDDRPVCPAIIWADGRSAAEATAYTDEIGAERLLKIAGSPVSPGFQAATLRWVGDHLPELLERTRTITTPGGYIRFKLTGRHVVDPKRCLWHAALVMFRNGTGRSHFSRRPG